MVNSDRVIEQIHQAFGGIPYPGDAYLQGSREGTEPAETIAPFKGRQRWQDIDPAVLDANHAALSFFSEEGFRFFFPAFLVADLRGQLRTADPLFHLTHGFHDSSITLDTRTRAFVKRLGKHVPVNPRRYGAMTFHDYARFRLSVFAREEAVAIVAYLQYRRDSDHEGIRRQEIDSALESFWLDRATHAPAQSDLARHVEEETAYLKEIRGEAER